jgi:hypothetical protein
MLIKKLSTPDITSATKFGTVFDMHVGALLGAKNGYNSPTTRPQYTPTTKNAPHIVKNANFDQK